ncbi:S-methyl-5-thioribose-1-phosphate isomerase [Streptomyces lonarensis]|uniref:Methylthioribose-1-phosphate isomerase n=1 Tax=Streptomyces lonarensis TaxID=700599 RepID=A0A7X6D3W2_9ACTN|nr:S-methyl-5-thioribose-1-phosphate isomerase [Streptomyces lonarensis]NJQ07717.1 S-methyl-5-thioribose-1-phosphate isomerase [Streptomyces lonarensis]
MADDMTAVLRWADEPGGGPAVVLLDQTRLPAHEEERWCRDVPALVRAIRELAVRGAPVLGVAGAYGVALAAARGDDVEAAAAELAEARPTAVNLRYGVERARAAWRAAGRAGGDATGTALAAARELHAEDARASTAMAGHGLELLTRLLPAREAGWRLLTHCNTGALVSGGEGTALAVVRAAHTAGRLERLWIDETRPLLQGARLTTWEAARWGLPHTLLADNAAGSLFAAGAVDAVLIGADRVSADGSVANKVGSYPLAVLAHHHGVPFVVVAPISTVDLDTARGADITIEQRGAEEVTGSGDGRHAPAGVAVHNPAFDVTPPDLVSALVTEGGVAPPSEVRRLAAGYDGPRATELREADGMMKA